MNAQPTDAAEERIEATRAMLEAAARASGIWLSADGRICENDAAAMLGVAPGTMARWRAEGAAGPCWYRLGGAGHRVSYRLHDLAAYIEDARDRSP